MKMLFALVGYVCTATVISLAVGIGYLRLTDRLTDERAFEIVALLHGVDLHPEVDQETGIPEEAPPEEPSLLEEERMRSIMQRSYEAKLASLQRGKIEFSHALEQLGAQTVRFNDLAQELQQRLEQEKSQTADAGVKSVVRDLKEAEPDLGKELLIRVLESGTTPVEKQASLDNTIRLIETMPLSTWSEIVNTFESEEEIAHLHRIHMEELAGGAKQRVLDGALRQLKDRDFGG